MYKATKSRYNSTFYKVKHREGESAMDYIKIFQNSEALYVSVGNYYSEDQIIHTILDNFHQGGKYSAQIATKDFETRGLHLSYLLMFIQVLKRFG